MKKNNKKGGAKLRHRLTLIEYLGNPENDFLIRADMARLLDISGQVFYAHFSPVDLDAIEAEAFEIRKARTTRQRVVVYEALYNQAVKGNVKAIKEFLDRVEGKVIDKKEVTLEGKEIKPILNINTNVTTSRNRS